MQKSPIRRGPWSWRALLVAAAVAFSCLCVAGETARAGGVSWTNYSVVTIGANGNPSAGGLSTTSDITGNAFVSGSVTGSSFTIGQDLPTVSNPSTNPQYSLTVAGNLSFSNYMNVNDGYSVQYAGSLGSNAHFNFNGGGILTHDTSGDLATAQTTLYNQVTGASSAFSAMATTGTTSIVGGNTLTFNYTGPSGGVAVFDVSASTLNSGSVQDLNLVLNGASSTVINVTGLPSSNFSLTSASRTWEGAFGDAGASKIIWNFGTLGGTLSTSTLFYGSIIAPDANFTNSTAVNGSIFVESYTGQGEIHYKDNGTVVQYNGYNPLVVPEPSTLVLAAFGVVGVGASALRRRIAKRTAA
jgi:choice-of-anchor A domain-containing protein